MSLRGKAATEFSKSLKLIVGNMSDSSEKIIRLSKTKIKLLIIGSLIFVGIGIWILQASVSSVIFPYAFDKPLLGRIIGWVSTLFFGLTGAIGLTKYFDEKPGVILNSSGITDNSSGISAGFVPWSEVIGFGVFEINRQKMLVVLLKNPDKYIEVGNWFRRALIKANSKLTGSPIVIVSNSLKMNFDELLKTCNDYFIKYGSSA